MTTLKSERLDIRSSDDVVRARQATRTLAIAAGLSLVDQTKIITAASELARNTLDYGGGGHVLAELVELPLVRSHNPSMAFAWTLVHEIEDGSPMMERLRSDGEFRLTVTVSGIDTLLASQALGGQTYRREDVLIDHEFDDMMDDSTELLEFDLTKLHDAHPRAA